MADRLYTVTGQRQTRAEGPDGRLTDVIEVSYVAAGNVVGSIRLPMSSYTAAEVDRLIRERVGAHLEVGQLGTQ